MTSHDFWPNIIEKVKHELDLYTGKNIRPTLRAMFYRLLSKNLLSNTESVYKELSRKTARARENGTLPINCFRDDSPIVNIDDEYLTPEQIIDDYISSLEELPQNYHGLPRWYNQPNYVEIWIEKNAMVAEFRSILDEEKLEVRLIPHGGYVSLTQLNDSVNRLARFIKLGKNIRILYFGDFDPSGEQMFDDIKARLVNIWGFENADLKMPVDNREIKFEFELRRIAVNKNHITEHDLPSEPLDEKQRKKLDNDVRTDKFREKHGRVYATELDALPIYIPDEFKEMVVESVNQYFDESIHDREIEAHSDEHSEETIKSLVKKKVDEFADKLANAD